jgi:hypothetical protein
VRKAQPTDCANMRVHSLSKLSHVAAGRSVQLQWPPPAHIPG